MRFAPPARPRRPRENIVPMINVVFLLLIFFLMTAQIAPPEPFEIAPPDSASPDPAEPARVLHVSAEGDLAYDGARGEAVFAALAADPDGGPLTIRADGRARAERLAEVLARLADLGISEISLATGRRP